MRDFLLMLSIIFLSVPSFASETCQSVLDANFQENGAPFSVVDKQIAISETQEFSELDEEESELVINLLLDVKTEVYSAYDSGDAGFHLLIVDKNCKVLWSGFVYNI